jgi:Fungal Zn(2)-Cys(6) binuclear cluster domain
MEPSYKDNDSSTSPEPDSKRRKVRKGTRSCWDCKRRKVKCIFKSANDAVCISCVRRGTACVSQEHPEEESHTEDSRGQLFDRVARVESLLEDLVRKVGNHAVRDGNSAGLDPSEKPSPATLSHFGDIETTESFVMLVSLQVNVYRTAYS